MDKKDSTFETFCYGAMCILSLGVIFLIRVIITTAIRYALKGNQEAE